MDDDRRREPRQPAEHLKARVRFSDRKQFERCYLKDISRGGIFLRTLKPAPLEAPIEVTLELPGGREVKLNGTVVHCLPPEQARPGQQPGLGVQFNDLNARVRKLLEGLLVELSSPRIDAPAPPSPAAAPRPAAAPGRAAPPRPQPPPPPPEFEERQTDPRGQRQTAPEALIPDQPIIEEEFDARATPSVAPPQAGGPTPGRARPPTGGLPVVLEDPAPASVAKPARQPTPHGVRAAAAAGASRATLETLRRLLWSCADVGRLAGWSHYDVIGVGRSASTIEIHASCEALRRAFDLDHPPAALGRDMDEGVAAVVALIDEIEQCLCDARRRAEYDRAKPREPTREPKR
ncbi:MAG: PilZ domain-containing protein [Deltaproteobacteria bacterium]|nr:PilZ domain-containing protein [Deltaproteobacteria bacterium]